MIKMPGKAIRKLPALILSAMLAVTSLYPAFAAGETIEEPGAGEAAAEPVTAENSRWMEEERAKLTVGNPTPLTGKFGFRCWGGTTSDLDVQDLLHGYSLVKWDGDLVRFRFDRSVVQNATIMDDSAGNRTYLIVLYDDLYYSDGTRVTAWDYAFSVLFQADSVIEETGGTRPDFSWLAGADEYSSGKKQTLSGLRVFSDLVFQFTVKADALPYFYELARLDIDPYPIRVIAPGIRAADNGEGVFLTGRMDAGEIRKTVINGITGYLSKPKATTGPYVLTSFDGTTARFEINAYYKGTEDGIKPRIGALTYTYAENSRMMGQLRNGEFGLLNKVTNTAAITAGLLNASESANTYAFTSYPRTGLTMIWFMESSETVQDPAVRRAIAYSLNRNQFIYEYTTHYGIQADGFYGIGQWMYLLAAGLMNYPVEEGEDTTEREAITLDGLTRYEYNPEEARRLLGGKTIELAFGIPDKDETEQAVRKWLLPGLEEAGFRVTLHRMSMEDLRKAYDGKQEGMDMIYLGEDFSILLDPDILKPSRALREGEKKNSLTGAKLQTYQLMRSLVKTEPTDLLGFEQKWIALQEKITETLPLIPVYSNAYFDFYTRELHEYRIAEAVTWAEAIVKSSMSDIEEIPEEEQESLQQQINELADPFGTSTEGEETEPEEPEL